MANATAARQRWFQTGGGEVVKSSAFFLLMVSLAVFIYFAYHSYAVRQKNTGDVVGEPQETAPVARRAASAEHAAGSAPAAAEGGAPGAASETSGAPMANANGQSSAAQMVGPTAVPATDTISPNPPNGMAFGGSGHFQVYRQGDVTWRLNTETGATCVLFATDAQWHQPRIRRAACSR